MTINRASIEIEERPGEAFSSFRLLDVGDKIIRTTVRAAPSARSPITWYMGIVLLLVDDVDGQERGVWLSAVLKTTLADAILRTGNTALELGSKVCIEFVGSELMPAP